MEPRQFVYLDDSAVRSLLASHSIAAPDIVKKKSEQINEGGSGIGFDVGIDVPVFGKANLGSEFSSTDVGKQVLESRRKVNEQYLFNILHEASKEADIIHDYTNGIEEKITVSEGDIIKFRGEGNIDTIYTLTSVFEFFLEITDDEDVQEMRNAKEMAYDGRVGFEVNVEESMFNFGMVLDESNIWINNPRDLMYNNNYIVFGRVRKQIEKGNKWDYPEMMRMCSIILADNTMSTIRQVIIEYLKSISDMREVIDLPDFESTSPGKMDDAEEMDVIESIVEVDIEEDDFSLDGPGFVIEPIAIYW